MDSKITELSSLPGYSRQPMETKHMLLSLNISDDYFKAKKQAEVFEQDLKAKDQEMYDLKHELVSLQVELDNAKASSKEFENKAKELEGKAKQLETEINKLRRKQ